MRILSKAMAGCLLAGALLGLGACGSSKKSSSGATTTSGPTGPNVIDIYSSLPLKGAVNAQTLPTVNGIKLALAEAGGKAGKWTINYQSLDDSTATSPTNYDLNVCQADARKAATDPKVVYYIGEFNSGCSKVVMPILNQAAVPEVSPANTYVGLTTSGPGTVPGEPQKYFPTGKRNYLRIVPTDAFQGTAGDSAMKSLGCTRVAAANDKTPYGAGLAQQVQLNSKKFGLTVTSDTPLDPTSPNYRAYAQSIKAQGVDCVYTGFNPPGEVELVKDVNAALPKAKIFGGDGVCSGGETNPAKGGFPASIAPLFHCTVATLGITAFPLGRQFLAAYKKAYGVSNPDPYAVYGYEAMKLGLETIAKLGPKGNDKAAVLAALFATKARHSVLGLTYGFDKNGDTTVTKYGLYKVGPDGNPEFIRAVG
jgi:branched-chain amino acid transport system substrate-binding protein